MNFKGKKILVVGFGSSGRAATRFFLGEGAKVVVTDRRVDAGGGFPTDKIETHFGGHPPEIFTRCDLICLSPGVPSDLPGLRLARRRRIPVMGEFGLAAEFLSSRKIPIIAVTGTNGKSTTVTLIAEMLRTAGLKTALAGNIGKPLIEVVMESKKLDWVVAEVSSYQLETVEKFRPKIGILLNITEDHLDRYASFQDYAKAKFRLFKEQGPKDLLLYNDQDPTIKKGVRRARARKIGFSVGATPRGCPRERRPRRAAPTNIYYSKNTIFYGNEKYPLDRVKLVGLHNVENMMVSIAAARSAGVPQQAVQKTLERFTGLPHRTEFVREREGVLYYDDSKGTNVDAAVKSLAGFPDGRVILIVGGRDKGGSYEPLLEMASRKAKLVIAIGEARKKIAEVFIAGGADSAFEIITMERLEEAVPLAASKAAAGDVVLLSPACSSFDQFKDYKERGDLFQKLVRLL